MISPELLRRYPFFAPFSDPEQKEIAMLADEFDSPKDTLLFEIGEPAETMYFLINGGVDLFDISVDEHDPSLRKEFFVGQIDPGELLSISALVDPYKYTATARTSVDSKLVKFNAIKLRELAASNSDFGYKLMHQIAKLALDRLAETRVMLAGMQS